MRSVEALHRTSESSFREGSSPEMLLPCEGHARPWTGLVTGYTFPHGRKWKVKKDTHFVPASTSRAVTFRLSESLLASTAPHAPKRSMFVARSAQPAAGRFGYPGKKLTRANDDVVVGLAIGPASCHSGRL